MNENAEVENFYINKIKEIKTDAQDRLNYK